MYAFYRVCATETVFEDSLSPSVIGTSLTVIASAFFFSCFVLFATRPLRCCSNMSLSKPRKSKGTRVLMREKETRSVLSVADQAELAKMRRIQCYQFQINAV